ncbi:DNA-directed RNA polymerase subunit K [Candidatus Woesearchaeota archaeon]|nr:DNA-directed RNA polymerase subunit K [Candidatus Woesearchaeota archaeon]
MVAEDKTEKVQRVNKYEMARMIGARALQISMGAPFMVKLEKEDLEKLHYNPVEIAKLEFEKGVMPIAVKRPSASLDSSASKE